MLEGLESTWSLTSLQGVKMRQLNESVRHVFDKSALRFSFFLGAIVFIFALLPNLL